MSGAAAAAAELEGVKEGDKLGVNEGVNEGDRLEVAVDDKEGVSDGV